MAIAIVKRRIPWSMRSRMQMLGSARAAYYGYISRTSDQRPIVTAHLKVDRAVHQTAPRRSVGIPGGGISLMGVVITRPIKRAVIAGSYTPFMRLALLPVHVVSSDLESVMNQFCR